MPEAYCEVTSALINTSRYTDVSIARGQSFVLLWQGILAISSRETLVYT